MKKEKNRKIRTAMEVIVRGSMFIYRKRHGPMPTSRGWTSLLVLGFLLGHVCGKVSYVYVLGSELVYIIMLCEILLFVLDLVV